MTNIPTPKFGIGAAPRRAEDAALITGRGNYIDDINLPGQLRGYMLRSPVANAQFTMTGLDAARAADGVHLILTAADISLAPLPCMAPLAQADGRPMEMRDRPVLCDGQVRHVGDPVAFIVAARVEDAKNAAELIEIDFDQADPVTDPVRALAPGAPLVWPERGTNLAFELHTGDRAAVDAAMRDAAHIADIEVVNNRLVCNYMETRGCIGSFDSQTGRYTLYAGTQGGHGMRDILAGRVLGIDPANLRIITPDVGGGFGTKTFIYHEYPLCLVAAMRLGRPVKWICERGEHFIIDSHGRDNVTRASLAIDSAGRFQALRVNILANMGAYLHQFGPFIPHVGSTMSTGLYDIGQVDLTVRGVYTHTVPVDAYRGAGRPEAAYLLERLVDRAAQILDISPVALRARNFITQGQLPYKTATGRRYDTGDFAGHLEKATVIAEWDDLEARRARSRQEGKYRGIGLCSYVEACAFAGSEEARLELEKDGTLTILIGTQSNGQGHATAYGQIVAEQFDVPLESINLVQGDTDRVAKGGGTGGSRSVPIGLPSILEASRALAETVKARAADMLEAGTGDLEIVGGAVRIMGTDRATSLAAIAQATPDTLHESREIEQSEATYPNGTHVCEVEVDPQTGIIEIKNYVIVDDFGVTVNPLLLAGQVHGGTAQAIGQALCEHTVYDEDGQLITASFLDYQMPRASDIPHFNFRTRNVPSTTNALGIKGAGEAGSIGGCAAVMNAVNDALRHGTGAQDIFVDMPATPHRMWHLIEKFRKTA